MAWILAQGIRKLRQRSNELVRMYRKLKHVQPEGAWSEFLRTEVFEIELQIAAKKKEMAALLTGKSGKESDHSEALNHLGEAEGFYGDSVMHDGIIRKERQLTS